MSRYHFKSLGFSLKLLLVFACIHLCCQSSFSQNKTIENAGDVLLFALPAAAGGLTLINKDRQGTWQLVKGVLVNSTIAFGLKSIVDKQRPDGSNNNSFPSGHTSITFQSASFIQKRYGWKYGVPAYLLSSFTGFSRIYADKHDIIDVIAGAAIGIGSTYVFTTPYQKEHMEFTFSRGDGNYLVGFKFKF